MSVLKSEYDLEKCVDRVWYESSNVIYSEFYEHDVDNFGELYIVFKGGKRYLYKNVSYMNYLYFKNAVFNEGSSGKALNEYIIKNYKGEKVDDASIEDIVGRLNEPDKKDTTYFIHGDGDVDEFVFQGMYVNTLDYVTELSSDNRFAVMFSNKYGMRSVKYLLDNGVDSSRITIYMKESDVSELDGSVSECIIVKIKDEKYNDDFIAGQIQRCSFEDIAYVSQEAISEIAKISKSASIILRRRMS